MSKIICDVCGTSFPETATHCPICGCAKSADAQAVTTGETQFSQEKAPVQNYGKGGRFAKNNTKRPARNKATEGRFSSERNRQNEPQESNKALIAVVAVLLLAIVMVVIYIGAKVFLTDLGGNSGNNGTSQVAPSGDNAGAAEGQTVLCTGLKVTPLIELTTENAQYELVAQKEPANCNEAVSYSSSDLTVATVDQNGFVVGVGYGQATITVTCGAQTAQCTVICTFGTPPTTLAPTQPAATAPAGFTLKLITYKDSGEITIAAAGSSHVLFKETNGVKPSDIVWTTSDPAVATVENGKVVGVDRGTATITATIGDQTATCLVRCPFDAPEATPYTISQGSATIAKGESFFLSLKNADGARAQNVEWVADKEGIVEIDGSKITGGTVSKLTGVNVTAEYEGHKYTCVVYVKAEE